jgi:aspartate/methionine/tyrosine aminotransferase
MFSDRTNWKLTQNRLTLALEEARARGEKILDLTVSNPTRAGLEYDSQAILSALGSARAMDYDPQAKGLMEARQAVAEYYRLEHAPLKPGLGGLDAERIVLTTSTSEGYSFVFRLLCNAGDELLVPKPSYPLFEFLADLQDVKLVPYPLIYDHGWQMDFPSLEKAVTARTRGVVVVHPNNPTGSYVKAEEVRQLNAFCRERGLAVIVDEVFLDYGLESAYVGTAAPGCPVEQSSTFADQAAAPQGLKPALEGKLDRSAGSVAPSQGNRAVEFPSSQPNGRSNQENAEFDTILAKKPLSFVKNNDVLTFTLSGLSKIAALPQMKVAWVVTTGPEEQVAAAMARLEVIADTYLSMNAPVQWAVPALMEQRTSIQRQLMERVRANLSELDRQLAAQKACERLIVEGGWYAVLRVPVTQSDEELAIALVREKRVLVHPGHFYDFPSDGYLVVSLLREEEFREGIGRVIGYLN